MSFQDLQRLVWNEEAICHECGEPMDAENTSVEAFERDGRLLCRECYECELEDARDDE